MLFLSVLLIEIFLYAEMCQDGIRLNHTMLYYNSLGWYKKAISIVMFYLNFYVWSVIEGAEA